MFKIADENDIDDIYFLNTQLFVTLNELEPDIYNPVGFSKVWINAMINSPDSDYILVIEDEKTVGYTLIEKRESPYAHYSSFVEEHYAYIYEIIILPEYRAKGYGKSLLEEAQKWAKKRKLETIELNTLSQNYSAKAFYEAAGYEEYQIKYRKKVIDK